MVMLLMFTALTAAQSGIPAEHNWSARRSVTGTIVEWKRNRIVIINDQSVRKEAYIIFSNDKDGLKVGDRVRIYYRDRRTPVISIKKLTSLQFTEDQNLGIINGRP